MVDNETFILNNKDNYKIIHKSSKGTKYDKLFCVICKETSLRNNFWKHKQSTKHIKTLELNNSIEARGKNGDKIYIQLNEMKQNIPEEEAEEAEELEEPEEPEEAEEPKKEYSILDIRPEHKKYIVNLFNSGSITDINDYNEVKKFINNKVKFIGEDIEYLLKTKLNI